MTLIEEVAVPIVEVAKRANLTLDELRAQAAALNFYIGLDWRHQEALSAKDAFDLVDGSARRNLDRENAWREHNAAWEQWQTGREAARREAFDEAWKANVKAGWNNAPAVSKAHESAREAVAAYEKANPEPVFEPTEESRLQRVIARMKAGTR